MNDTATFPTADPIIAALLDRETVVSIDPESRVAEVWTLDRAESNRLSRVARRLGRMFTVLLVVGGLTGLGIVSGLAASAGLDRFHQRALAGGALLLVLASLAGGYFARQLPNRAATCRTIAVPDGEPYADMLDVVRKFERTMEIIDDIDLSGRFVDVQCAANLWAQTVVLASVERIPEMELFVLRRVDDTFSALSQIGDLIFEARNGPPAPAQSRIEQAVEQGHALFSIVEQGQSVVLGYASGGRVTALAS